MEDRVIYSSQQAPDPIYYMYFRPFNKQIFKNNKSPKCDRFKCVAPLILNTTFKHKYAYV